MRSIGQVEAIFRYPVKSMAGHALEHAELGWHGVEGDRRYALRRLGDDSGKPWLTASKLPALVTFRPNGDVICAPDGRELALRGDALLAEIMRRYGAPVQMARFEHGMFDEGDVSVIARSTIDAIRPGLDVRRFRPNLLLRTDEGRPFEEDAWVGDSLVIGDVEIAVTMKDERCAMVNIDPDTAAIDASIMRACVQLHDNHAGVYGTVIRRGRVTVGDRVSVLTRR